GRPWLWFITFLLLEASSPVAQEACHSTPRTVLPSMPTASFISLPVCRRSRHLFVRVFRGGRNLSRAVHRVAGSSLSRTGSSAGPETNPVTSTGIDENRAARGELQHRGEQQKTDYRAK